AVAERAVCSGAVPPALPGDIAVVLCAGNYGSCAVPIVVQRESETWGGGACHPATFVVAVSGAVQKARPSVLAVQLLFRELADLVIRKFGQYDRILPVDPVLDPFQTAGMVIFVFCKDGGDR